MSIHSNNILACHTFHWRDSKAKTAIIVRFANQKSKTELLRQARKLSGMGIYLNEHLTKKECRHRLADMHSTEAKQSTSHMDEKL